MSAPESDQAAAPGLRHYADVVRRRKWLIALVTAIAAAAALAVSMLQPEIHRATTKIVIGQGNSLFQPQFGNAFQPFTATARELVESNVVADAVIDELGLERSPEQLLSDVSVSINPETAVLAIEVRDEDAEQARAIAQALGEEFSALFNDQFGGNAAGGSEPLTATVWDPARIDPTPVSPRPVRNVAVALVLGLVLGLVAAFLREHFDRALRTREEVERAFGLPVIGQVPFGKKRRDAERAIYWNSFGEGAEAFRALRANLQYLAVKRPLRTILVASASPEQGKTTVTANLAVAIARSGATAVAVEGDLRRPRLDEALGAPVTGTGLTSVLVGSSDLDAAVVTVPLPDDEGEVAVLPSGPLPPNPSELLSSMQMSTLLEQLAGTYDFVLVDSPPLLLVSDALELARIVDGVVLVVRRNHATTDEARELRALVERLGVQLVGVVLADVEKLGTYGTYGDRVEGPPLVAGGTPGRPQRLDEL
jgi:capsular exopolysaccharide synthesis family protein